MNDVGIALTAAQKERILRDIWILHDGRWFIKSIGEVGFEAASKLNLDVAGSIGKTEIRRLIAELDCESIRNIKDFKNLMEVAADLYFPKEHQYRLEVLDDRTLVGHVMDCYVYRNVINAGTVDLNPCAAKKRLDSWFTALGLQGEVVAGKNTANCNGACMIVFKVRW